MATPETRYVNGAITANGGIASIFCEGHATVGAAMSTSSLAGHAVAFEVSNDAQLDANSDTVVASTGTWYPIGGNRTATTVWENVSSTFSATPAYGWVFQVSPWRFFRVRATAHTSGSATWCLTSSMRSFSGNPLYNTAIASGTALIGDVGIQPRATSGGFTTFNRLLSAAASTNSTNVKASAGRIYGIYGYNAAAAARYLKLYNKATPPTVGTDTPILTFQLIPTATFNISFLDIGVYNSAGIGFGLTTGSADADTGALTAGDITCMNIIYI